MDKLLAKLNKPQLDAVNSIKGPLLVLAGAGTGKTRVITFRIANMLKHGVLPENILALTFTNKAAKEMRERIKELVDSNSASKLFLGTFHSFCIKILREEVEHTILHKGFTIADDVDQKSIIKQIIADLGLKDNGIDPNYYRSMIGKAKNELKLPSEVKGNSISNFDITSIKVYKAYQDMLTSQNMVDFDDILMLAVRLLGENEEVVNKYRFIYKYILVDEFQDTNYAQFTLLELLSKGNNNLCVVGDDDQSIYGWRGAKIENILNFPNQFKGTKVVKLEQNYRSTNNILKAANAFISGNKHRHDKVLWSDNGDGKKIVKATLGNDIYESNFVASEINNILKENSSYQYSSFAVLYRSNYQSRLLEDELRKASIPYRLVGSKSFYERKEVRDAIAYLKVLENLNDDQSLLRIMSAPPRGLGAKFIEKARDFQKRKNMSLLYIFSNDEFKATISAAALKSVNELVSVIFSFHEKINQNNIRLSQEIRQYFLEIGFLNGFQKMYKNIDEAESRKENVLEFINSIAQFENTTLGDKTLENFLETFSLSDDNDRVEESDGTDNAVTLLTVHSSKGLEFSCVFIIGMEHEIFPHARSLGEGNVDEERRLFYVAITRAKEKLYMTNSSLRYKYGYQQEQLPSTFLDEIPEELIEDAKKRKKEYVKTVSVDKAFSDFFKDFKNRYSK